MACPICLFHGAVVEQLRFSDGVRVTCVQCSAFDMTRTAINKSKTINDSDRWRVSAWIRDSSLETVDGEHIDAASVCAVPSLSHRAARMLRQLYRDYPAGSRFFLGQLGEWRPYEQDATGGVIAPGRLIASPLVAAGWNHDVDELIFMLEEVLWKELGFLTFEERSKLFQISPKGLMHLEGRSDPASTTGFCAMWFSPDVFPLWTDVIEPAIRSAGYDPLRMDKAEFNDKIDDEIMASIRSAKFVVSDFSGHRGGVYYEAGFAHGLGLPVIFMCRESDLNELHFDIRQYNCIDWSPDKLEVAQDRLKNRILATLGQGPLKIQ